MKRVVIESPYAAIKSSGEKDIERFCMHQAYLRKCLLDSLDRGEAPFASHAIYTQVLNDDVAADRYLGIGAGLAWGAVAELVAVYVDMGISRGMNIGIASASASNIPIEYRSVGKVSLSTLELLSLLSRF